MCLLDTYYFCLAAANHSLQSPNNCMLGTNYGLLPPNELLIHNDSLCTD